MVNDCERGILLPPLHGLLHAPHHRWDSTYQSLCCTSHGVLAGTRTSSMDPSWWISLMTHHSCVWSAYLILFKNVNYVQRFQIGTGLLGFFSYHLSDTQYLCWGVAKQSFIDFGVYWATLWMVTDTLILHLNFINLWVTKHGHGFRF